MSTPQLLSQEKNTNDGWAVIPNVGDTFNKTITNSTSNPIAENLTNVGNAVNNVIKGATDYTLGTASNSLNNGISDYLKGKSSGVAGSTGYGIGNIFNSWNNARTGNTVSSDATVSNNYGVIGSNSTTPYADVLNQFSNDPPASFWDGYLANQKQALAQQATQNTWNNWLGIGSLALSGLGQWLNYSNAKKQLAFNKQAFAQQQANWNETYNNKLKQYNTELADRLRARAAFETGDSAAYDDEIEANSARRGETGNSSSSYLNYKRSSNANKSYNKDTKNANA